MLFIVILVDSPASHWGSLNSQKIVCHTGGPHFSKGGPIFPEIWGSRVPILPGKWGPGSPFWGVPIFTWHRLILYPVEVRLRKTFIDASRLWHFVMGQENLYNSQYFSYSHQIIMDFETVATKEKTMKHFPAKRTEDTQKLNKENWNAKSLLPL